jgi:hypothetical protein
MKSYKATGQVYGYLWGGGQGAYPARTIESKNQAELIKRAEVMLADGSLDSGMGFESLTGALLEIETYTEIIHKGNPFHRSDFKLRFIGRLTGSEKRFLKKIHYQLPF